jgi:hypothetical protein
VKALKSLAAAAAVVVFSAGVSMAADSGSSMSNGSMSNGSMSNGSMSNGTMSNGSMSNGSMSNGSMSDQSMGSMQSGQMTQGAGMSHGMGKKAHHKKHMSASGNSMNQGAMGSTDHMGANDQSKGSMGSEMGH